MDLRVLRCFLTIAKEQGFTKAAEQLHITQPTLSRQLAAFEEGLDYIRITDSDHWVGGMRPDDPLAGKEYIEKKDLLGKPLILPERIGVMAEKYPKLPCRQQIHRNDACL